MRNKLSYNRAGLPRVISRAWLWAFVAVLAAFPLQAAAGNDAPPWMHSLTTATVPSYDEKTDAVLLYSETNVTVVSADKVKTQVREVYKILRPAGRHYGEVAVYFRSPSQKITSLHGWCIPASGKDFEVKEKDALEMAVQTDGGELVGDVRMKLLRIPAPDPGNIVGYEYEVEEHPLRLRDRWVFQEAVPVRESHYSLQLPPGWEYRDFWFNYPSVKPTQNGNNLLEWSVSNVKGIRQEAQMPPFAGVSGQMELSFFPAGGPTLNNSYADWKGMGSWYSALTSGRIEASPELKQEVATLTASRGSLLGKMQAIADFVQHDIRYVAIELGIGGWQPHPAADVFAHRYGDCKDKATLMRSMLHEIGVESYYVVINVQRGAVSPDTPANDGFDHAIVAIKLPDGLSNDSLVAVESHPKLGKLLFFDPTNDLTPFGEIGGYLQANYGLLVTPDGGELVQLPQQPSAMNSIQRTAKLVLDSNGILSGDVDEIRLGDRAFSQRLQLRNVTNDKDRIKAIENVLASSLANFQITHASLMNLQRTDLPFGFEYSFQSESYAKNAGDLLLVRPCVLGRQSSSILETKEPREFPVEFESPVLDSDTFEIKIPDGYTVDDLPDAVNADYSFASYHSKTIAAGGVIRYTRTFELKQLSVPVSRADELRRFYRQIAGDERSTVVLKAAAK
jgi:hypothetical protein